MEDNFQRSFWYHKSSCPSYNIAEVDNAKNVTICTSDLKFKEAINTIDGKRLGGITDIEIDVERGKLVAIVVPGSGKLDVTKM